ncbi:MAG TPA: hypothetical protein PK370_02230 [Candidatus Woesebacteria bacterium]|nr:hypothetical protein [Candidatus Woesebacteria bacterium]HPJ17207.1 hypothetical protein [Candidatus Woesebacteria bacterium]
MTNKKNNSISIGIIIVLAGVLLATISMIKNSQDTRRGAYFAGSTLSLKPDTVIERMTGEVLPVHLWVESKSEAKVDSVKALICYGNNISINQNSAEDQIEIGTAAGFNSIPLALVKEIDGKKCLDLTVASDKGADKLKAGAMEVAVINFKADSAGEGEITIIKDGSKVSGDNPNNADKSISVDGVVNTKYKVSSGNSSTAPLLKMVVAFKDVRGDSQCANNWPLKVTVMAPGGVTKSYTNIIPTKINSSGDLAKYSVSLRLVGFDYKEDLAVFVKGPKHLQWKYGVNNQTSFYDKQGGKISLTSDESTSTTYDFSGYPLLPGDITGEGDVQDGIVDGRDFSLVKSESIKRTSSESGGYLKTDLNGNCQMESLDVASLMISLSVKQEQLY